MVESVTQPRSYGGPGYIKAATHFSKSLLNFFRSPIDQTLSTPDPLLEKCVENLTSLYKALVDENRPEMLTALRTTITALEKINEANYKSPYLSSDKDKKDIDLCVKNLKTHLETYRDNLSSVNRQVTRESLKQNREKTMKLLVGQINPHEKVLTSLSNAPSPLLSRQLSIGHGVLLTFQQIYFQNTGYLVKPIEKVCNKVKGIVTKTFMGESSSYQETEASSSNIDAPKWEIEEGNVAAGAPLEDSPIIGGIFGHYTTLLSHLSGKEFSVLTKASLYPLRMLLEALEIKLQGDKSPILPSIQECISLINKIADGDIKGQADTKLALKQVFTHLSNHTYWVGSAFNFGWLSPSQKERSEKITHKLRQGHATLNKEYQAEAVPKEISSSLLAQKVTETGNLCTGKAVFELLSRILGETGPTKTTFESIYKSAKNSHPSSFDKDTAIKQELILKMKKKIDLSEWFFLWGWFIRPMLKLLLRPMFYLFSRVIFGLIDKLKNQATFFLSESTSKDDKAALLKIPLEIFTAVTKGIRESHLEHAKTTRYDSPAEACTAYFQGNKDFLKDWNFTSLSNEVCCKAISEYTPRHVFSSLLNRLHNWIRRDIDQIDQVLLRGFVFLVFGIPLFTIIWIVNNLFVKPVEFSTHFVITNLAKFFIRRTKILDKTIQDTLAPLKTVHENVKPTDEVVSSSVLMKDTVLINLLELLHEKMNTRDNPRSKFATQKVDDGLRQTMHVAIQNMMEAIDSTSVNTPCAAAPFEKKGLLTEDPSPFLFGLIKRFTGPAKVHSLIANGIDELASRCYELVLDPKILTNMTHLTLTTFDKLITQEGETMSKEEMREKHLKNSEYIESLLFLILREAFGALATATQYTDQDDAIVKHGEELKTRIPRFLTQMEADIAQILGRSTFSKEDATKLKTLFEEYLRLIAFVNEKPLFLSLQGGAGSSSVALYNARLIGIKEKLEALREPFIKIYKVFFDMSLIDNKVDLLKEETDRVGHKIETLINDGTLLQKAFSSNESMSSKETEKTLEGLFSHLSEFDLSLQLLKTIHENAANHPHLTPLISTMNEANAKLKSFTAKIKENLSFLNLLNTFENPGHLNPKARLCDHLLQLQKAKNPTSFSHFKDKYLIPKLQELFPLYQEESSFDKQNYKAFCDNLHDLSEKFGDPIEFKDKLTQLEKRVGKLKTERREKLLNASNDFSLPSTQEALKTSLACKNKFLIDMQSHISNWNVFHQNNSLTSSRETLRLATTSLRETAHQLDPNILSVRFSLSDIPLFEQASNESIPFVIEFVNRIVKIFLGNGPGPALGFTGRTFLKFLNTNK